MAIDVVLVFDIGKTNKKVLLFDNALNLVFEKDEVFDEITDDDNFSCDDIETIEKWLFESLDKIVNYSDYHVVSVNFSTYGASLVYLDENKKRLTPVYNYLKPMPEEVMHYFYDKYGGIEEFCRSTASPALGMLNSGLQIRWLKKVKPEIFSKVRYILHLPQYLGFLLTGKIISEATSIGCHTAMWNFDKKNYHIWLADEGIELAQPIENSYQTEINMLGRKILVGTGIHDSSASLVPYLIASKEKFILISTGTWCVFMNPFNDETLTPEQLEKDTLCYLSPNRKQVKASRLFLGHIHKVNEEKIADYFGKPKDYYKQLKFNKSIIEKLSLPENKERKFFKKGVPPEYVDTEIDYSVFATFEEAYHRLMLDLVQLSINSLKLVTAKNDDIKSVYISGGFAKSELFTVLIAKSLSEKQVFISEINNSSALGAAIVTNANNQTIKNNIINLNLKEVKVFI